MKTQLFQAAETKAAQEAEQTHQIIPSNRLWMMRCDWVTTISNVTWVQPNWKRGEHIVQPAQSHCQHCPAQVPRTPQNSSSTGVPGHLTPRKLIYYLLFVNQPDKQDKLSCTELFWHRGVNNGQASSQALNLTSLGPRINFTKT